MLKFFALILLVALIGACSKSAPTPTGIAQFDEVRSVAEKFVMSGDSEAVRKHSNFADVPFDALAKVTAMLDNWQGASSTLKLTDTKVMTLPEYETLRQEDKKDLPADMREAFPSAMRWNVTPEKVIVFTLGSKDPNDTTTRVRWSVGAYQTNGLWFFAVCYPQ